MVYYSWPGGWIVLFFFLIILPTPSTSPFCNWWSCSSFLSWAHQGIFGGVEWCVPYLASCSRSLARWRSDSSGGGVRWGCAGNLEGGIGWIDRGGQFFSSSRFVKVSRIFKGLLVGTFKVPGTPSWPVGREEESFSCSRILTMNPFYVSCHSAPLSFLLFPLLGTVSGDACDESRFS